MAQKYFFFKQMKVGSKDEFFWTPYRQNKLEEVITTSLQKWGGAVFAESQRRVPVVTGNLKASGSITFPPDGFEITYTAEYANDVEVGRRKSKGAVPSQPWTQHVGGHWRKTQKTHMWRGTKKVTKGRVYVKAHTKTYLSGKPVLMPDGQWRIFTAYTVSKGRRFLSGALGSMLTATLTHTDGLQKYLQTDTI